MSAAKTAKVSSYSARKEAARAKAIEWQEWFATTSMSWGELADWQAYFTRLAKRYGLVREFKENAII